MESLEQTVSELGEHVLALLGTPMYNILVSTEIEAVSAAVDSSARD